MDWANPHYRMALARLFVEGTLAKGTRVAPVVDHLLEVGWIARTPRRNVVQKVEQYSEAIEELLERVWPDWRDAVDALLAKGLSLTVEDLAKLRKQDALSDADILPPRMHRKTLAAILGLHSKAALPTDDVLRRHGVEATTDNLLRIRANEGLVIESAGKKLPCDPVMAALGEVVLPERATLDGLTVSGQIPRAVLTVENLGAFVDLSAPPEMLVAHTPGWDSPLTLRFLEAIPSRIQVHHFGDLDHNGVEILRHLRQAIGPRVRWFVPSFWEEYLRTYGLRQKIGCASRGHMLPEELSIFEKLGQAGRCLEQEVFLKDCRLNREILAIIEQSKPTEPL